MNKNISINIKNIIYRILSITPIFLIIALVLIIRSFETDYFNYDYYYEFNNYKVLETKIFLIAVAYLSYILLSLLMGLINNYDLKNSIRLLILSQTTFIIIVLITEWFGIKNFEGEYGEYWVNLTKRQLTPWVLKSQILYLSIVLPVFITAIFVIIDHKLFTITKINYAVIILFLNSITWVLFAKQNTISLLSNEYYYSFGSEIEVVDTLNIYRFDRGNIDLRENRALYSLQFDPNCFIETIDRFSDEEFNLLVKNLNEKNNVTTLIYMDEEKLFEHINTEEYYKNYSVEIFRLFPFYVTLKQGVYINSFYPIAGSKASYFWLFKWFRISREREK